MFLHIVVPYAHSDSSPWIHLLLIVACPTCGPCCQRPFCIPVFLQSPCVESDFQLLSLCQFSTVNTTSTINYSKGAKINDGVVESPPAIVPISNMLHRLLPFAKRNGRLNAFETCRCMGVMTMPVKGLVGVFAWKHLSVMIPSNMYLVQQPYPC